jgi:aspartyl/glutamyl-tRNA(Asn/Gln) amidotransferase C subunit
MSDQITPEVFSHLVELAALELGLQQAEYIRRELNHQLKAIHELEAIPLEENVSIAAHGVSYTNQTRPPLRQDQWHAYEKPASILEQVPHTEDGYIVVPDIPHTTLE